MEAKFVQAIEAPWIELARVRIGQLPSGVGTPDEYVLVGEEGAPYLRIDIYRDTSESQAFREAVAWAGWIAVGFGDRTYLVSESEKPTVFIPLGSYFGHLYPAKERLLIASGERLLCIGPSGETLWVSDELGIDGVIVSDVEHDIVSGEGEWDPPGGWRPFRLDLGTGERT
jgi:hypothetical protein